MMNSNEISRLAAKAKQGDKTAFEKLYKEFYPKVYYFAKQNTGSLDAAEDITAETFSTALEKLSSLRSEESFVGWLYCIAYHKSADHLKKTALDRKNLDETAELAALSQPLMLPDDYAVNEQTKQQLQTIIDSLPPDMRSVIILYYYDNLSLAEVAQVIGTNKNNASQKLYAARKKLRRRIEKLIGKGSLFSAVPVGAVLANLESTGLLSGVSGVAAIGAAAAAVPVGLSALSGGTSRHLLGFTLKYWRRHKKSLAALLFSGVLLCAVVCCAFLMIRQDQRRWLDDYYDQHGYYTVAVPTPTSYDKVIDLLSTDETTRGTMYVTGEAGIGVDKFQIGTIDDPENLAHIPLEQGRMPREKGEIMIDRGVLDKLGFFGGVGDTIELDKSSYTIVGVTAKDEASGRSIYGYRHGSVLKQMENAETNYYASDDEKKISERNIPLIFISDKENQKPLYTWVMLYNIRGIDHNTTDKDKIYSLNINKHLQKEGLPSIYDDIYSPDIDMDQFHNFAWSACEYYDLEFHEQVYAMLLLYGAAVIIAVLSVIAVMRNIFSERENTLSMLRRIGMSKRRMRVMFAVEYLCFAVIQAMIGITVGTLVHLGIYKYQTAVLEMSDISAFTHNEFDRWICPDPFAISILISAAVLLVGYVFAALMLRTNAPSCKKRKARSLWRCFGRVFKNCAVTVIQTVSLSLICFAAIFGYMLIHATTGIYDDKTGEFHELLDTKFGSTGQFDLQDENVTEYYHTFGSAASTTAMPMLMHTEHLNGVGDNDCEKLDNTFAKGTLLHTMISCEDPSLPHELSWTDAEKKFIYDNCNEKGKEFIDSHNKLYKCKTSLSDRSTIKQLETYVISGEINTDKLSSGEEILYVVNHTDSTLKAGDKIGVVSADTTNGFGISEVNEAAVRIGAVIEISADMDNMLRYAVTANDDVNLLTTVTGAQKLGLHGATYNELIARDEIGKLLPMGTGFTVKSLKQSKHDIFVQNATVYGSIVILMFILSLLGFSAYFNGIGMKIRMKEYQISIMRAIGTPLKKLRRRLMFDSIRIPVFAGLTAYGLTRLMQFIMVCAHDRAYRLYELSISTAEKVGGLMQNGEYTPAATDMMNKANDIQLQAANTEKYFLTGKQMWFVNALIPTLIVFAVMCMITILLTRRSFKMFTPNIAYSISKGRKRR